MDLIIQTERKGLQKTSLQNRVEFDLTRGWHEKSGNTTISDMAHVLLTSRFEATRRLFWDGPRNFEPRSDDEDDAWAGTSLSKTSTPHRRLAPMYDLACNRPNARRIFSGIGFRTWNPPAPKRHLTSRPPHVKGKF
ncbi:hypothetical protein AVEN_101954-1 [Araneus ventricosus]|uniref:Uncharacterized protein n=1 Tax=Araneus ventricosus TaxID=182803 RepID=A0A4Y2K6Y8_ARAVE|nr:hypothetical protein AVEN_101954-1 [Araneus ventricosus]